MGENARINLVVSHRQKQEWKTAARESVEYASLSGLVRTAVAHELADGQSPPAQGGGHTDDDALEEVQQTLGRIESTLSDFDARLQELERETKSSETADLRNRILKVLPPTESIGYDEVADRLGEDMHDVSQELRKMAEQTNLVEVAEEPHDTGPIYYQRQQS